MQELILVVLLVAAIAYMGRRIYRQYKAKSGCASAGCDACAPTTKEVKLPGHFKG